MLTLGPCGFFLAPLVSYQSKDMLLELKQLMTPPDPIKGKAAGMDGRMDGWMLIQTINPHAQ